MKKIIIISLFILASCQQSISNSQDKQEIAAMLDSFNQAAATANHEAYFDFFADNATFMGTDATEYWTKKEFKTWSKPYFDKKTTWNFKSIQRHIYFTKNTDIAWFDELLLTQMKICRGSGVVVKQGDTWKVAQYVLSATIPNEEMDKVIAIKTPIEDSLIATLLKKQNTNLSK